MEINIYITAEELGVSERALDEAVKTGQAKCERGGWLLLDADTIERVKAALVAKWQEPRK